MSSGLRAMWALFIGVALVQFGHGLQGSLTGILANRAQFSETTTGLIMSGFYAGLLISTLVTPGIVTRVGHIRVFAAFASLASTAALLMPIWVDPVFWFALRLISGFCIAGLSIVAESWLNSASDNTNRGQMLSVYMIIMYASTGLGQFLLNVQDTSGFVRFIIVSVLISIALVPTSLAKAEQPEFTTPRPVALRDIYLASPLAFIGTFAAGLGQSVFFSMGAVYGVMEGLSIGVVSLMMALPSMAVIVSQYPVGMLSDRYDRRKVLMVCSGLAALIAVLAMLFAGASPVLLIALFSLFGAVSFPVYALALAHANDYLERDQMLGASSKLILLYGVGAIIGPLLAGGVMQQLGSKGFMTFMIAVYGLLAAFAAYRMMRRPETPDEAADLVYMAPSATSVAAGAIAEEFWDDEVEAEPVGAVAEDNKQAPQ